MDSEELYAELKKYFPNNLDLMRHLHINACWEYVITENSTNEETPKLHYFLYKKDENNLEMTKEDPMIKPDLILYFTENYNNKTSFIYFLGNPMVWWLGFLGVLGFFYLIIRNFFVNPSGKYIDVPKDDPDDFGYAFHAVNVNSQ